MKYLKRCLITIVVLILVAVAGIGGAIFFVINYPTEAWGLVQRHFLPEDLKISWQGMALQNSEFSFRSWKVDWTIDGLMIEKQSPFLNVPLEKVHLRATVEPGKEIAVHELTILGPQEIRLHADPPATGEKQLSPFQQFDRIIKLLDLVKTWTNIEKALVDVKRFVYQLDSENSLLVTAKLTKEPSNPSFTTEVHASSGAPEKQMRLHFAGGLNVDEIEASGDVLRGDLDVQVRGVTVKQQVRIGFRNGEASITLSGLLEYQAKKLKLVGSTRLELRAQSAGLKSNLEFQVKGLPGPLARVENGQAKIDIPFDDDVMWSERVSRVQVSAPLDLFFVDRQMRHSVEKSCNCKLPERLRAEVQGDAWLAVLLSQSPEKKPMIDVVFHSESLENKLITLNLAARLKIHKEGQALTYEPTLNSTFVLHSFQGLRQILDAKNILVPAPLDVLEGPVQINIVGPVGSRDGKFKFPVSASTQLDSKNQKVRIKSENSVEINEQFSSALIRVGAHVEELQLELPPLDPLRGKPRVALDRRILLKPKVEDRVSRFEVQVIVDVETTRNDSIRLLSEYFHPHLSAGLKVRHDTAAKAGTSGSIRVEPFEVEYLKRKLQVVRLNLDLSSQSEAGFPVDGRFKVARSFYTIFIDVSGLSTSPQVRLSSEPYLAEADIISVLLYNRTTDQLASADAATAGGVQAAVADRAIGLFGLWAFAATPIKSFSYNAATKTYSATVDLPGEVSAAIGTNWESATSVELRKRVTQQWVMVAKWTPATANEDQSTKVMLEWERRF